MSKRYGDAGVSTLSAPNGLVDLRLGQAPALVAAPSRVDAAGLPDGFDPGAVHEDVDRLLAFSSMDADAREYLLDELAFSLLGSPSGRLLWFTGPPAGGKTTLVGALRRSFGAYVADQSADGPEGDSDELEDDYPAPESFHLAAPARLSFTDRVSGLTAGGMSRFGDLYETRGGSGDPTATAVFASNEMPIFQNGRPGIADRVRVVYFPALPPQNLIRRFAARWDGDTDGAVLRRQALVAAIAARLGHIQQAPTPPAQARRAA